MIIIIIIVIIIMRAYFADTVEPVGSQNFLIQAAHFSLSEVNVNKIGCGVCDLHD